jgi:hypothetical protein
VRPEDATCSDKSQLVLEQSHGINWCFTGKVVRWLWAQLVERA